MCRCPILSVRELLVITDHFKSNQRPPAPLGARLHFHPQTLHFLARLCSASDAPHRFQLLQRFRFPRGAAEAAGAGRGARDVRSAAAALFQLDEGPFEEHT